MGKSNRKNTTVQQLIQMNELYKEALNTNDGLCYFNEGWDDFKVAEKVNVPVYVAASTRRKLYGNFIKPAKAVKVAKKPKGNTWRHKFLVERVNKLELKVLEIERSLGIAPRTVSGEVKPQPNMEQPNGSQS